MNQPASANCLSPIEALKAERDHALAGREELRGEVERLRAQVESSFAERDRLLDRADRANGQVVGLIDEIGRLAAELDGLKKADADEPDGPDFLIPLRQFLAELPPGGSVTFTRTA